jgi:predicted Fe-Mo cluster-binding NifX family protein
MSDTPLKLAVATKDGISINLHFGHATQFWVYEVTPEACTLLEQRDVEHYCHGQHGSKSAMEKILQTIKDCNGVFVAMIGDGPADKLKAIGVTAISDYAHEAVEESLVDYAKRA